VLGLTAKRVRELAPFNRTLTLFARILTAFREGERAMFRRFIELLGNQDGFTAIEYGLVFAMLLIFVGQLASRF